MKISAFVVEEDDRCCVNCGFRGVKGAGYGEKTTVKKGCFLNLKKFSIMIAGMLRPEPRQERLSC